MATATLTSSPARDFHAEAEARLGRTLTVAERVIRLAENDRILEDGKAQLAALIEQEKRRVIRDVVDGRTTRMRVTVPMLRLLQSLWLAGRAAAEQEIADLHGEPGARQMAAAGGGFRFGDPEMTQLVGALRVHLQGIDYRISSEIDRGAVRGTFEGLSRNALARAIEKRVPGALDAASYLVSPAMAGGMGDVFGAAAGLFDRWVYTAVMDAATCSTCASYDGRVYDSWEAIQVVLPDGGPNPYCHGGSRCRCRPVPYVDDEKSAPAPPNAPEDLAPEPRPEVAGGSYVHWTSPENAEAILRGGMQATNGGAMGAAPWNLMGRGAYLSLDDATWTSMANFEAAEAVGVVARIPEGANLLYIDHPQDALQLLRNVEQATGQSRMFFDSPETWAWAREHYDGIVLRGTKEWTSAEKLDQLYDIDGRVAKFYGYASGDQIVIFRPQTLDLLGKLGESEEAALARAKAALSDPIRKGPVAREILGDFEDTMAKWTEGGEWAAERRKLHREIIERYLAEGIERAEGQRQALFLAGGSGSGKSTILRGLGERVPEGAVKIDPDEIKDLLPEFSEMVDRGERYAARAAHEESSYISKLVLNEANARGMNVIIDGTGDSEAGKFLQKIAAQKDLGYRTRVIHVDIATDTAVERAIKRAKRSGRWVPEDTIRDIHEQVAARHPEWAMSDLVDEWEVWANDESPKLIAAMRDGKLAITQKARYERMIAKATTKAEARRVRQQIEQEIAARAPLRARMEIERMVAELPKLTADELAQVHALEKPWVGANGYAWKPLYEREEKLRSIGARVGEEIDRRVRESGIEDRAVLERREKQLRRRYQKQVEARDALYAKLDEELAAAGDVTTRITEDPRFIAATEKKDEAFRAWSEASLALDNHAFHAGIARRDVLAEMVAEIRGSGVPVDLLRPEPSWLSGLAERFNGRYYPDPDAAAYARVRVEEATRLMPRAWVEASDEKGPILALMTDRGHYLHKADLIAVGNVRSGLHPERGHGVAIHEFGHRVDRLFPEATVMHWTFLARRLNQSSWERTKLQDLYPNGIFDEKEVVYLDEFVDPYIGKDYGFNPDSAYEILSTGLEGVFDAAYPIWERDPDMRNYILGMLFWL